MAKIKTEKRRLLHKRAKQLLKTGHEEDTAVQQMVNEKLCSEPIARGIVRWVIAAELKKKQTAE